MTALSAVIAKILSASPATLVLGTVFMLSVAVLVLAIRMPL
jgi:hypothetical protein